MGGNGGDLQTRALRYLYPEKIFQQFEGDNATWTQFDPRVEWLLELLVHSELPSQVLHLGIKMEGTHNGQTY